MGCKVPNTYTLISSVTVGAGGASSIDFTSIPSTYTDLCLKVSARNTGAENAFRVRINGDSSSIYSARWLLGTGAAASSNSNATQTATFVARHDMSTDTASTFGNAEIYIPNYAGSTAKSLSGDSVTENNATTAYTNLAAGLYTGTTAISQLTLIPDANSFAQYSTAYLYGIKNSQEN